MSPKDAIIFQIKVRVYPGSPDERYIKTYDNPGGICYWVEEMVQSIHEFEFVFRTFAKEIP